MTRLPLPTPPLPVGLTGRDGGVPAGILPSAVIGTTLIVPLGSLKAAIWMMRALVVSNVLARREETLLYVPLDAVADPEGKALVRAVTTVRQLAKARGVLRG